VILETKTDKYNAGSYPWPVLEPFGLTFIISSVYGLQYLITKERLAWYFGFASIPLALTLAALSWHSFSIKGRGGQVTFLPTCSGFRSHKSLVYFHLCLSSVALHPIPRLPVALGALSVAGISHLKWGPLKRSEGRSGDGQHAAKHRHHDAPPASGYRLVELLPICWLQSSR
jgi:hypothetical protein